MDASMDRIAAVGTAHPLQPPRAMAATRGHVPGGRCRARSGTAPGAGRVDSPLGRRRHGHRREGRAHGRCARTDRRPGQPGPAGAQGPLRMAGERVAGPADHPPDPAARAPRGMRLGHRHGADRRPFARVAGRPRPRLPRLLHERPAVPGGVLHPRRAGPRRDRHQPPRRQHPPVHGHRGRGPEGILRLRRPARLLRRHRPRRRHRPVRPQHRRDPARAVDARPRPAGRQRPAPSAVRRPTAHAGRPPCRGAPGSAPRNERHPAQRPPARDHPHGPGRPRLRHGAHGRLRGTVTAGGALYARVGRRDL